MSYDIAEVAYVEGHVIGHVIIDRTSHHIYRPWVGSDRSLFGSAAVALGAAQYMERHSPYRAPLNHYLQQGLFDRLPDADHLAAPCDHDEARIADVVVAHMRRMYSTNGRIEEHTTLVGVSYGVILGSSLFTIRLDMADGRRLLVVGHVLPAVDRVQELTPDWDGLEKLRGEPIVIEQDPREASRLFLFNGRDRALLLSLYAHAVTLDETDHRMSYYLDGQQITLCTMHAIREADHDHTHFWPLPDVAPGSFCVGCRAEQLQDMAADNAGHPTAQDYAGRYHHEDPRYAI